MRGDWGPSIECARTVQMLRNAPMRTLKGLMMNVSVNWEVNGCEQKFVDNHSDDEILPTKRGVVPFSNSPGTEITMEAPK